MPPGIITKGAVEFAEVRPSLKTRHINSMIISTPTVISDQNPHPISAAFQILLQLESVEVDEAAGPCWLLQSSVIKETSNMDDFMLTTRSTCAIRLERKKILS